jgi:hypothetical protein
MRRIRVVLLGGMTAGVLSLAAPAAGPVAQSGANRALHTMSARQFRLLSSGTQQGLLQIGINVQALAPGGFDGTSDGPQAAAPGTSEGGAIAGAGISGGPANVSPGASNTCSVNLDGNVKVNQDCLNATDVDLHGRAQAQNETSIAVNPLNPNDVVASANDYRRGDGGCGGYFSQNGGQTWGGGLIPHGFTRGQDLGGKNVREYWTSGGDTAVAWDSSGTAYEQCQLFNRGAPVSQDPNVDSSVYVFRSDNKGASWNFPGRPVITLNGNPQNKAGLPLEDKPFMGIDAYKGDPRTDRIYVSWTEFREDGSAPILLAYSKDHGETFSKPALVSNNSPLCEVRAGSNTALHCDSNQFSEPVVGPDHSLYVVWANYNNKVTGNENRNQMLLAKSTDGGASFSAPVKVADYYDLPDCASYAGGQDPGRACIPEKGSGTKKSVFRAANYPTMVVDPRNANRLVVHYPSYINQNSNEHNGCVPQGLNPTFGTNLFSGVLTLGACNNDIQVSVSTNGGTSFSGTHRDPRVMPSVNRDDNKTDQFWQWTAVTPDGKIVDSFYDRQYGNDETTGASDITVVSGEQHRVTSSSMPPPTEFGGVFLGDYSGLALRGNTALPFWADTRDTGITSCTSNPRQLCRFGNDEDVFTAAIDIGGGDDESSADNGGGRRGGGGGQ